MLSVDIKSSFAAGSIISGGISVILEKITPSRSQRRYKNELFQGKKGFSKYQKNFPS